MRDWLMIGGVLVVVAVMFWFLGRTPDKVARASQPPREGSPGGGGGLSGLGGMHDDRS
jgi:hypothetical protein